MGMVRVANYETLGGRVENVALKITAVRTTHGLKNIPGGQQGYRNNKNL
jgi:hypothetical protein